MLSSCSQCAHSKAVEHYHIAIDTAHSTIHQHIPVGDAPGGAPGGGPLGGGPLGGGPLGGGPLGGAPPAIV
jgi:hypothetical protein